MKLWRRILWLGAMSGLVAAMVLALSASRGETKGDASLVILGTASAQAELTPCG